MPDFSDPTTLVSHGAASLTSGGLGAWLMNFLRSREEKREKAEQAAMMNEMSTSLKLQNQMLIDIKDQLKDHKAVFEDVVTAKNGVKALGEKFDDLRRRVEALETRRRPR